MADITAPWAPGVADRIAGTLRHIVEVRATHPSWSAPISLDIETGTLAYSETQMPFVTAQMAMRIPDAATLALLDPRIGVRIEIYAGYVIDRVRDVHLIANLWLSSRNASRPENLLQLTAESAESRVLAWTPLGASKSFTSASDAGTSISELIHWALPDALVNNTLPAAKFVTGADTLNVGTGDNLMRAALDIADRGGSGWVYEDGLGMWYVGQRPTATGVSAAILKTGPMGTIRSYSSNMGVNEWFNAVLVEHSWYDGEQRTAQGWAEVTSGPLSVSAVGRRVLKIVREYTGDAATARTTAGVILARTVTRGYGIEVEVAGAPYWLRPGQTVTVQLPGSEQERHLVTDVQFSLDGNGIANITTRKPDTFTITTGA